jgi:hypothetical protein
VDGGRCSAWAEAIYRAGWSKRTILRVRREGADRAEMSTRLSAAAPAGVSGAELEADLGRLLKHVDGLKE